METNGFPDLPARDSVLTARARKEGMGSNMETLCILCDGPLAAVEGTPAPPEDSQRICDACKALPREERKTLRDRAMTRMLLDRDG